MADILERLSIDIASLLNREIQLQVKRDIAAKVAHHTQAPVPGITAMQCMRLHNVEPDKWTLMESDKTSYITNSVLFGRLRSRDYQVWLALFQDTFKRDPFCDKHWREDINFWKRTYVVDFNRACDVTLLAYQVSLMESQHGLGIKVAASSLVSLLVVPAGIKLVCWSSQPSVPQHTHFRAHIHHICVYRHSCSVVKCSRRGEGITQTESETDD